MKTLFVVSSYIGVSHAKKEASQFGSVNLIPTVTSESGSANTSKESVPYSDTESQDLDTDFSTKDAPTEMDAYYDDVIRENDALQMIFANIEDTVDMQRKAETLDRKEIDRLVKRVLKENHSNPEPAIRRLTADLTASLTRASRRQSGM